MFNIYSIGLSEMRQDDSDGEISGERAMKDHRLRSAMKDDVCETRSIDMKC